MDVIESIVDRRIKAGREAGLFDNLAGAGKPIPDLDRERPPGWWAARLVRRERIMLKAEKRRANSARILPSRPSPAS